MYKSKYAVINAAEENKYNFIQNIAAPHSLLKNKIPHINNIKVFFMTWAD